MVSQEQKEMRLYYALPNPNLKSYLARQKRGINSVVKTPFLGSDDPQTVLEAWDTELVTVRDTWPTLYQFESDMRDKVGPMSVQKPLADRLPSLRSYYTLPQQGDPFDASVTALMMRHWAPARGMHLRGIPSVVEAMKKSTNSGSPYFTVRSRVLERSLPYTLRRTGDSVFECSMPDWSGRLCATYGWRGQEGGPKPEDTKQRDLWMFPMIGNISEFRVYQPLIAAAQRHNLIPPWNGLAHVDAAITRLFDTKGTEDLVVCTDFTKFDQHFGASMQNEAAELISALFTGSELSEWLEHIYPMKYNIPICYEWGRFYSGWHGMASGSGGTNADETLAHKALQYEAAARFGSVLNDASMCLGDDGLLSYPGIKVEDVVQSYASHGLEMNTTKQYSSKDDCIFLRNWHHTQYRMNGVCVGVYPTMRALGHLMFMERFIDPDKWGRKAVAMRQLSIIENCRYHPLGTAFIKFCLKRDKYRLGIDIPGFISNIDAMYSEAKANDSLHISYSQEFGSARPPSEWWVIKELQRLI